MRWTTRGYRVTPVSLAELKRTCNSQELSDISGEKDRPSWCYIPQVMCLLPLLHQNQNVHRFTLLGDEARLLKFDVTPDVTGNVEASNDAGGVTLMFLTSVFDFQFMICDFLF